MDKIELTEEQAIYIITKVGILEYRLNSNNYRVPLAIDAWKEKGIIKQNPVEKAEEWYNLENMYCSSREENIIRDFKEAINYLKKQLEEKC
jgi:hypothetical protein